MRRRVKLVVWTGAIVLAVYAAAAYLVAPMIWGEIERVRHAPEAMLTHTAQGIPGDPVNIGLVGTREQVVSAFVGIGWHPADQVTLKTSIEIGLSVVLDRPYADAPVSALYYDGRRQDLAFEREDGASASRRHHLRLWLTLETGDEGRPLWLGSASYDRDAGFSHDTGQVTHHIAPDVDAERDMVMGELEGSGLLSRRYEIPGRGATQDGRNGGGDRYFTDGLAAVGVLKP